MAKKDVCIDQLEKPEIQVSFTDQIPPDIWSVDVGIWSVLSHKCIININIFSG